MDISRLCNPYEIKCMFDINGKVLPDVVLKYKNELGEKYQEYIPLTTFSGKKNIKPNTVYASFSSQTGEKISIFLRINIELDGEICGNEPAHKTLSNTIPASSLINNPHLKLNKSEISDIEYVKNAIYIKYSIIK